jgi:hypothetical protein
MSVKANVRMLVGHTLVLWGPSEPIAANDDPADWRAAALRNRSNLGPRSNEKANASIQYLRVVGE